MLIQYYLTIALLLFFSAVSSLLDMIVSCIVNFILLHYAFHCIVCNVRIMYLSLYVILHTV